MGQLGGLNCEELPIILNGVVVIGGNCGVAEGCGIKNGGEGLNGGYIVLDPGLVLCEYECEGI